MRIESTKQASEGLRFSIRDDDKEVGRAYLYIMRNDLHDAPFGLLEDVYVDESQRGAGVGTRLVREAIDAARQAGCYKLIATSRTSRPKVHELYGRIGFAKHGFEFRIDFDGH